MTNTTDLLKHCDEIDIQLTALRAYADNDSIDICIKTLINRAIDSIDNANKSIAIALDNSLSEK